MNERLRFLWEEYVKMVELLVTLTTGTIAVSAGLVKLSAKDAVANRRFYAAGMATLMIALVAAVLWRVAAQLFMEQEVLGDPSLVEAYYASQHLTYPFTTSHRYSGSAFAQGLRLVVFLCQAVTALGFLTGLALLSLFAHSNLPEQNRSRSR
jgi:hypothetical protein